MGIAEMIVEADVAGKAACAAALSGRSNVAGYIVRGYSSNAWIVTCLGSGSEGIKNDAKGCNK